MTPEELDGYLELFRMRFREEAGKVFNDKPGIPRTSPQRTVDENTTNHEHIRIHDPRTVEGVRANHALAAAVAVVWRETLRRDFPERAFRVFASNEYVCEPGEDRPDAIADDGIDTVVRAWSLPADYPSFDEIYRPDEAASGRVLWREFGNGERIDLETAIAALHDPAHPARFRALRRWSPA